jgi:hypothetical protein
MPQPPEQRPMQPSGPGDEGMIPRPEPRFPLGQLVATPGALEVLQEAEQDPLGLLVRHVSGDWGDLEDEDKQENEFSVDRDLRILSAYNLPTGKRVWIITEADRSATTLLLPDEY